MRINVEMSNAEVACLDAIAKATNSSRSRLIRDAVSAYLLQQNADPINAGFGIWKDRKEDGLAYQNRMREEWSD